MNCGRSQINVKRTSDCFEDEKWNISYKYGKDIHKIHVLPTELSTGPGGVT